MVNIFRILIKSPFWIWLNPQASLWGSTDGVLGSAYTAKVLAEASVPEQQKRESNPSVTLLPSANEANRISRFLRQKESVS